MPHAHIFDRTFLLSSRRRRSYAPASTIDHRPTPPPDANANANANVQPRALAHWLWGHELLTFQGEATETYTKWAALAGPFFRVKGALFHPDIVSV